jgi:hypothetical protein
MVDKKDYHRHIPPQLLGNRKRLSAYCVGQVSYTSCAVAYLDLHHRHVFVLVRILLLHI